MITPNKNYPGRKGAAGQWQKILEQIPRCKLFIDAMTGSGVVSSLVEKSGCDVVLNDIDEVTLSKIQITGDRVTVHNFDFTELLMLYDNSSAERVFYFDPPYMKETRSYQPDIYRYDWNSEQQHADFLKCVKQSGCPVIISHYPCELYDETLKGWRVVQYNAMTRAGLRVENLYMNFPQPGLLQCPGVVGDNFTDRQRIKRKVARIVDRLKNERAQDRAAILSSVINEFSAINSIIER